MSHPFTSQRKALILYSMIWLSVGLIEAVFLRFNKDFSLTISFTEGLLCSLLLGIFGLIVWYPTSYIPYKKDAPIYSISAHFAAGLIIIASWLIISIGILRTFFGGDEPYNEFLNDSVFWRGFVGVMVYLVLILIYYLISYARSLRQRAQAEEKLKTLVRESELNMLKSQINPHFLFNSLNSISSLIMSNPDKAQEMIIRLSDFLRYSLKHRENEFISLEEEIGRMKDYLSIEQIRFGDKLHYELKTSEKCNEFLVPTMILQPLIENAIKHGVYESLKPVSLIFSCNLNDTFLELELANDYDPDQPSHSGTGVGLQNVSERIRLAYDGKGRMNKTSQNGVYKVRLFIPVDQKNEP